MAKRESGMRPEKIKTLAPTHQAKWAGFSFQLKNLAKHPLLPLLIGILATGLGKDVLLAPLVAVAMCALWLCADLFPFARRIGVWTANRCVREYRSHFGRIGQIEAEAKRAAINKSTTCISFAALCLVVMSMYARFANWDIDRYLQNKQEEVASRIETTAATDSAGDPSFSFTNNSTHSLTLMGITCHQRYARTTLGFRLKDTSLVVFSGNVLIHSNGDGQSSTCSVQQGVGAGFGRFVCADMTWEITYRLPERPATNISAPYRFFLNPLTNEWSRVGLEAPPQKCPGE